MLVLETMRDASRVDRLQFFPRSNYFDSHLSIADMYDPSWYFQSGCYSLFEITCCQLQSQSHKQQLATACFPTSMSTTNCAYCLATACVGQ